MMEKTDAEKPLSQPHVRLLPVAGLMILSPFVGEYLLGNVPARQLYLLPFLIPLYGAGAILVREVARRTGGGCTTTSRPASISDRWTSFSNR
jgi:hypothetical protein